MSSFKTLDVSGHEWTWTCVVTPLWSGRKLTRIIVDAPPGNGARAHDLTTFVSATGPGTQPQIIKKSTGGQKKDVHIKDAKGWADLSKGGAKNAPSLQRDESDALWKEFKGKEQEKNDLKEQRKALEEGGGRGKGRRRRRRRCRGPWRRTARSGKQRKQRRGRKQRRNWSSGIGRAWNLT